MLRWLLSLFGRRRPDAAPIREDEAYARSYGNRSGEIISVARLPEPPEPARIPRRTGDMTGELLRRAFEAKLDRRGKASAT